MDESDGSPNFPQEQEIIPGQPKTAEAERTSPLEGTKDDREEPQTATGPSVGAETEPNQPLEGDSTLLLDTQSPEGSDLPRHLEQHHRRITRRQVLIGIGVMAGVTAIGVGTPLALLTNTSAPGATSRASSSSPGSPAVGSSPPPQGTPTSLDQRLQAWRTKQLTASRSQRFKHHTGTALVPLGVVETSYPNKYNPYHVHLQGYVLGGALVANTDFFLYLGLESIDGSQFVGKVRVGPIDQAAAHFGILVTQQSTDDIEGGTAEDPLVMLPPKAFYHALSALAGHCIVMDFIRQPLPAQAQDEPQNLLLAINQQAQISDQFLQVDFEVIHHTPLSHIGASKLIPIRHLIDTSPITYTSAADGAKYPLVTQVVLRHTDQLYPKLVVDQK
jgi:hypothetical protein